MASIYNRQKVQFTKAIDGSHFIAKVDGACHGDVIGHVTVNEEIGYMTVRLHEDGKERTEMTLYKPYEQRSARINHFLAKHGYVLA